MEYYSCSCQTDSAGYDKCGHLIVSAWKLNKLNVLLHGTVKIGWHDHKNMFKKTNIMLHKYEDFMDDIRILRKCWKKKTQPSLHVNSFVIKQARSTLYNNQQKSSKFISLIFMMSHVAYMLNI